MCGDSLEKQLAEGKAKFFITDIFFISWNVERLCRTKKNKTCYEEPMRWIYFIKEHLYSDIAFFVGFIAVYMIDVHNNDYLYVYLPYA